MNIILEGPDAVGKSTLAEYVKNKYNYEVIHSTAKTRNDLYYHMDLIDYHSNTVMDRFHFGEMIFPEIYKREGKLSKEDFNKINRRIVENHDMFIVFTTTDINILKDRLIARGELNYLEEIAEQNTLFTKLAKEVEANYPDMLFYNVDINSPTAYKDLYDWVDNHINETTPNMIYKQVCKDLIEKGHVMETRNIRGNTKELCNYSFTITNINNPIITLTTGKCDMNYLAGELLWYWNARNDLDFIGKFGKMWSKLTDDGITNNSAYGYILKKKHGFDQIEKIIELLTVDPYSRRAVLNINVPNENVINTKDEMCTIALDYMIRDGKLHCTCIMRSNDVNYGLRNDLGYFLTLQKYIADRLGVKYGTYTHYAISMHVYERDYKFVNDVAYGTTETVDEVLNVDKLLEYNYELVDYVDNHWVSRKDFTELLMKKNIICKNNK